MLRNTWGELNPMSNNLPLSMSRVSFEPATCRSDSICWPTIVVTPKPRGVGIRYNRQS